MKNELLRFTLYAIIIYLTCGVLNPAVTASPPSGGNGTHFCGVIDDRWNKQDSDQFPNRHYARTSVANLNVGEPRTVRMIYFTPNDWQYRADIVRQMKDDILTIQDFYAEQMEAHGYGKVTFRIETDSQGEPMVHRVDGQHPFSHYDNTLGNAVIDELEQGFNLDANVYFIVLGTNALRQSNGMPAGGVGHRFAKSGGALLVPNEFSWDTVAHELGHAFGLHHDFRDGAYIMSYGPGWSRLSSCSAEFLSVHPYFNPQTRIEEGSVPSIEHISPRTYTAGARSVPIRFKVSDFRGLHQVLLYVFHDSGDELKTCRRLMGETNTIVEFDYDGVIPSDGSTKLSNPIVHSMRAVVVNTDGDVNSEHFGLSEFSSQHIVTFPHQLPVTSVAFSQDGEFLACGTREAVTVWNVTTWQLVNTLRHNDWVSSVSFSPTDLPILASGSEDNRVNLWNAVTAENIATLEGHTHIVSSVSFSRDGKTLASGSFDNTIKLWDVATQAEIATLEGHTDLVLSVSFSPTDPLILASGSFDNTVKLWDIARQRDIATLEGHTWGAQTVSFSPNGTMLAAGSGDGTITLWNVVTREIIATYRAHREEIDSVSFSHDGKTLASGSFDNTIKLWDVPTLVEIVSLKGHTHWVHSVSFSPDGAILASASQDSTAMLWEVAESMEERIRARTEIDIPDANLRAKIEEALGKTSGATITTADMVGLTHLEAPNANISDLTGLESATNLTVLNLGGNSISDISLLVANTGLGSGDVVNVSENPLNSASITTHIRALQTRGVIVEFSVDIPDANLRAKIEEALGKASGDTITTADMANLTILDDAENANITNLTGLETATNLTVLEIWGNSTSDISPLANLTHLTHVWLVDNPISDLSPLANLPNLTHLFFGRNRISDISPLANLTSLEDLALGGNSISDISTLEGLTNLTRLHLGANSISDISTLEDLTNLTELFLSKNRISDISPLANLTSLEDLSIWDNSISDISPLADLTNLTHLRFSGNTISDLSPLANLTNLTELFFGDNIISDISPLANLTNLTHVWLSGNTISNISPLAGLNNLTRLWVRNNSISDISPLVTNTGLGEGADVDVSENPLSFASINDHIPALRSRGVEVHAYNLKPSTSEYTLRMPAGISLIHIPLRVTEVNGAAQTIGLISDLYDALGGVGVVNFLITYDTISQEWYSYFVPSDKGGPADSGLGDDMGIIVGLRASVSLDLSGNPLGTDGSSAINLHQGLNVVGLPLDDSRINRVSDLLKLDGIEGNVPVIILTDGGEFKLVGRAGDPGDIEITGGQAFIMTASRTATVDITGDAWANGSGTAAAPPVTLKGVEVGNTTPVLALRGSIVDEETGLKAPNFRVIVKNFSTGRAVAAVTASDEAGYQLTVVDIETGRAATVGDVLEISAQSPNPFIGVEPLRYTVTAEDVKQSLIQLPELVAYEIPAETELLANYPNPFNPETWIPYRLAEDAFVTLTIYDLNGQVVRTLDVGHRIAAVYEGRSKAIYWDGRNDVGEQIASGVYFYHLSAGDYSATRKMLILK